MQKIDKKARAHLSHERYISALLFNNAYLYEKSVFFDEILREPFCAKHAAIFAAINYLCQRNECANAITIKRLLNPNNRSDGILLTDIIEGKYLVYLHLLGGGLMKCQSPIERQFCQAILPLLRPSGWTRIENRKDTAYFDIQKQIGKYRCDFVIGWCGIPYIVIECDGHDFHYQTKEQVEKDRSRDRELQTLGFKVLRFTGSEIFRNPNNCAMQAIQCLKQIDENSLIPKF